MRDILIVLSILSLFRVSVYGACTGSPPTYNGLPCATTTRYWDDQKGACGCGDASGNTPFSWNGAQYTAAASQNVFDPSGSSWCGIGCGACFEITPTGDCPTGGTCASNKNPVVIMVTNLCPYSGNQQWCPNPGATNQYGYAQHFDLRDPNMTGWVDSLGWNNPVVTYQQVECGSSGSPTCTEAAQCQCSMTPCYDTTGASSSTATSAKSSTSTSTSAKSATSTSTSAKSSTSTATSAKSSTSTSTSAKSATSTAPSTSAKSSTSTATSAKSSTSTSGSTSTSAKPSTSTSTSAKSSTSTSGSTTGSSGSGTCTASVSTTVSSSWSGGGQIAITVTNTGSKSISQVVVSITGAPSVFNLVATSGSNYNLASYAYPLAPSAAFTGAGFTYSGSQPSVTVSSVSC